MRIRLTGIILTAVLLAVSLQAKLRNSMLSFSSTADIIPSSTIGMGIRGNYFSTSTEGGVLKYYPYIKMGFGNRVEFSGGFAGGTSLSFKTKVLSENPDGYFPDISIGCRNIITSEQASYFELAKTDTSSSKSSDSTNYPAWKNTAYAAISKTMPGTNLRLHLGLGYNAGSDEDAMDFNFGIEEYLGSGLYVTIEGFRKSGNLHSILSLNWYLKNTAIITLGLSELKDLFYDGEKAGFYLLSDNNPDGYNSPGIWFGFSFFVNSKTFTGGFNGIEDKIESINRRVGVLEERFDEYKKSDDKVFSELEKIRSSIEDLKERNKRSKNRTEYADAIPEMIGEIERLLQDTVNIQTEEINKLKMQLKSFGRMAVSHIEARIVSPETPPNVKTNLIFVLGGIRTRRSRELLIELLESSEDPEVLIETIISLGKFRDTAVIPVLSRIAENHENEAVKMVADNVIGVIQNE